MRGQAGFWDIDDRYGRLSAAGDPLEKLNAVVPWEVFRKALAKVLQRSDGAKGGRQCAIKRRALGSGPITSSIRLPQGRRRQGN